MLGNVIKFSAIEKMDTKKKLHAVYLDLSFSLAVW